MKQLLTVTMILLCACLTQGFTKNGAISATVSNNTQFNYARFMHSLWLPSSQARIHAPRMTYAVNLTFTNYWYANAIINWVALGDESLHGSPWYPPLQPGDNGGATYYDGSAYGPVYVSISLPGLPEDPTAVRAVWVGDTNGYHCQEITGDGVYVFYNLFFGNLYGIVTVDTGGCY